MRTFNLVVLDESDLVIDRYYLNYVTGISGLGYELKVSTIETDIKDYVTKIVQQKKDIKLTVIHTDRYKGQKSLTKWLESNYGKTVCLEYSNDVDTLYCEGMVVSSVFDEVSQYKVLDQSITFKPLTPFFKKIENKIIIKKSSNGKMYPLKYPYSYGVNMMINNEINNTYFRDVPVIVTIYGTITNPHIVLADSQGDVYNEVVFRQLFVDEGQKIIINSAQKKVWFDDGSGQLVDYYNYLDGGYDSYLIAMPNELSSINVNLDVLDTGYLIGSWRQYTL